MFFCFLRRMTLLFLIFGNSHTQVPFLAPRQDILKQIAKTVADGTRELKMQRSPHLVLLNLEFYEEKLKEASQLILEWPELVKEAGYTSIPRILRWHYYPFLLTLARMVGRHRSLKDHISIRILQSMVLESLLRTKDCYVYAA